MGREGERENFLFISRDVFRTTQTEDRERVGVCWAREKGRAVEMLLTVVSSAALLPLPFYLTVCLDPDDLFFGPLVDTGVIHKVHSDANEKQSQVH